MTQDSASLLHTYGSSEVFDNVRNSMNKNGSYEKFFFRVIEDGSALHKHELGAHETYNKANVLRHQILHAPDSSITGNCIERKWYANAQMAFERPMKKSQPHGVWRKMDRHGKTRGTEYFLDGEKRSQAAWWFAMNKNLLANGKIFKVLGNLVSRNSNQRYAGQLFPTLEIK